MRVRGVSHPARAPAPYAPFMNLLLLHALWLPSCCDSPSTPPTHCRAHAPFPNISGPRSSAATPLGSRSSSPSLLASPPHLLSLPLLSCLPCCVSLCPPPLPPPLHVLPAVVSPAVLCCSGISFPHYSSAGPLRPSFVRVLGPLATCFRAAAATAAVKHSGSSAPHASLIIRVTLRYFGIYVPSQIKDAEDSSG